MSSKNVSLSVREMLLGDPVRLRYVRRYSSCRVNHDETVAEHSYYVTLYAMLLADWYVKRYGVLVDYKDLMQKCVLHDLEEARTGDMPRYFKYSSPEMARQAHESAATAMSQLLCELVDPVFARAYFAQWQYSKSEGIEGSIVALADFLSVVSFVIQEYASGNRNATEHIRSLDEYFSNFYTAEFSAFNVLVDEARHVFESVFGKEVFKNG